MPYLLDADWAIEALANRSPAVDVLREVGPSELAISWITVGEIFEGAFGTPDPAARLATFRAFLQPIQRIGVDDAVMSRFAELRAMLRRQGQLISDFDIVVAATALEHNLVVLTFNVRHLGRIPGLQIYQLSAPPRTRRRGARRSRKCRGITSTGAVRLTFSGAERCATAIQTQEGAR